MNHSTLEDLDFETILPFQDLRETTKIPLLSFFGFVNRKPKTFRESLSRAQVIRTMREGLEGLATRVLFCNGRVMVELLGDFRIGIQTLTEHGFHLAFIGLPHDDSQVRGGQVDVEKGHAGVGDEELADVGEVEAGGFFPAGRDVLEIQAGPERVLRAGKAVGFCPADVEGTPHAAVGVEGG